MEFRHGAALAAAGFYVVLSFGPARSQSDDLYRAETIVTGVEEAERMRGFAIGAEDVLIKLTGKARFAELPRGKAIIAKAADLVAEHSYEDRMKGIPTHDEQGTRDRPHFLRMRFDADKFDAALKKAGLPKWERKRPLVAVWLAVKEAKRKYVLAREGDDGYGQREVLKSASARRAIPVVLPEEKQEEVSYDDVVKGNWSPLLKASEALGADAVLYGTLDFDGKAAWNVKMVAAGDGAYAKWRMSSVSFDVALKGAIDRVAAAHAKQALLNEETKKR